jgi:hypothetical protein
MKTLCKSVLVLHGNPFDRVAIEWNIRAREAVGDGPVIECDTHLQAALAVQGRDAWCVVPSRVADLVNRLGAEGKCGADVGGWCQPLLDTTARKAELASDALCLVTRERELERISGADKVLSKLTIELAKKFRT